MSKKRSCSCGQTGPEVGSQLIWQPRLHLTKLRTPESPSVQSWTPANAEGAGPPFVTDIVSAGTEVSRTPSHLTMRTCPRLH